MNIIISSLDENGIKITNLTSKDIDNVKLFVLKELNITPLRLELVSGENTYPVALTQSSALEKAQYYGYTLSAKTSIPLEDYTLHFYYSGLARSESTTTYIQTIGLTNGLEDEHDAVFINGRQINRITTPIVAQDLNSQQIRFYIKKMYDGISFLDEFKKIYVDYIPADGSLPEEENAPGFWSDEITEILDDPDPIDHEGDWLLLKWNVPQKVMEKAGTVRFALSVVNIDLSYVWQTFPSSFTVSENLGFRTVPVFSEEEVSKLTVIMEQVEELRSDVNAIEETIGYQSDDDVSNDQEVIISGGTAEETMI